MVSLFGDESLELFDSHLEIENFEQIAKYVIPSPGDLPDLQGIDVFGQSIPLNGLIGGDHIIYVDFKRRYNLEGRIEKARIEGNVPVVENLIRCRSRAGIALADVSGHRITDGLLSLMLHQAFLLGAIYELDFFGEITTRLFENLNSRFYSSSSVGKFLTLVYGEISEEGKFRFISAAHPLPVIFSSQFDRFVDICPQALTTFPPIGTMPSSDDIDRGASRSPLGLKDRYQVNELNLMGNGDILILYSDGLSEHSSLSDDYFPTHLENKLREVKMQSAHQIFNAVVDDLKHFGPPTDDISLVVIKRS